MGAAPGSGSGLTELVARLGPHPARTLGLDLARDADVGCWFVAACLLAGRVPEERALGAYAALGKAGLVDPTALAAAAPEAVATALESARYPKPGPCAYRLQRAGAALSERYRGSFDAVAGASEALEELGARVAGLAPGIGVATVARFLRPLRERWPAALELPLDPPARAAAVCLGVLSEGEDEEGEPGALRAVLRCAPDAPSLADVEAGLGRLGRRACARARADRCPMGAACGLQSIG